MMVPIIIAATVAVAVIGDTQNTIDSTNSTTDTGANDTADSAAHGTSDAVTLVRTFLSATHNALGVAGLRHASQGKKDGGGREEQADGQTRRQLRSGNTSFVHLESPRVSGGGDSRQLAGRVQRPKRPNGCAFVTNCRRCERSFRSRKCQHRQSRRGTKRPCLRPASR